jgi:hypothetical protein
LPLHALLARYEDIMPSGNLVAAELACDQEAGEAIRASDRFDQPLK